jgi:precorrin-6B methylase 1
MPKENRPLTTIHNQETNEIVTREMNDEEFASYERDTATYLAKQAEAQAKAQAKAALLERLGLTQEEFNILTAQS